SGAAQPPPERRTPEPGRQILPSVAAPSARDVSVDLSEQMPLKRDDVKEAVRASKVMQAAEVPRDLLVPGDDDKTINAPAPVMEAHLPRRAAPRGPEATAATVPVKPVVPLPTQRPTPPKLVTPVPEPPELRKTNPIFLVVLILVLIGGAAFLLWKYVLDTTDTSTPTSSTTPATPTPTAKPAPPPEP